MKRMLISNPILKKSLSDSLPDYTEDDDYYVAPTTRMVTKQGTFGIRHIKINGNKTTILPFPYPFTKAKPVISEFLLLDAFLYRLPVIILR